LNSLSSSSILSINNHTTQISNLNATSTSIFNNLNSLSSSSILSINSHTTQISNLQSTSGTLFNKTNFSSLSVVGDINISGLSVFNTLSGKQNNLTFSNPLLNTSNTVSLKYDSTKLNVDASGNLTVVSGGTSQWTTTGTSIFYNGNVDCGGGIGITGSNAFFTPGGTAIDTAVDAGNLTNTYLNFKKSPNLNN
jgi:hypothetical protein